LKAGAARLHGNGHLQERVMMLEALPRPQPLPVLGIETRESLYELVRERLRGRKFIVVSNREPYMHVHCDGQIRCLRPASGVTVALDPVMQATGGLWIAHGSGSADAEVTDERGVVAVPPEAPAYQLRRVWLTPEQEENYYYGFANTALWPLCHVAYRSPVFRQEQWQAYVEVNRLFADRIAEEINGQQAFVFVQDYHFALLPGMLRERAPQAIIAHFWHIPWPNPEVFRICPWKREILRGLLGNDLLGFHIRYHGDNFLATVGRELEARIDHERSAVVYRHHMTKVRAFPISIDFEAIAREAASRSTEQQMRQLRQRYGLRDDTLLILGVDRIDYTKGLLHRMEALEQLLERYPDYLGRIQFVQIGVPSRLHVAEYQRLNQELAERVEALNRRFARDGWQPVLFLRRHAPLAELVAWYRLARVLVVSSLHDGMNLVAKEFVAARVDHQGVLVLSRFTGAARQLREALLVNPYAPGEMAEAMHRGLQMPTTEQRLRMQRLRDNVRENNVYKWAADIIRKLSRLV
jgi:alpha,alpha-trehalose-phosphate synthase [UDP-forming]